MDFKIWILLISLLKSAESSVIKLFVERQAYIGESVTLMCIIKQPVGFIQIDGPNDINTALLCKSTSQCISNRRGYLHDTVASNSTCVVITIARSTRRDEGEWLCRDETSMKSTIVKLADRWFVGTSTSTSIPTSSRLSSTTKIHTSSYLSSTTTIPTSSHLSSTLGSIVTKRPSRSTPMPTTTTIRLTTGSYSDHQTSTSRSYVTSRVKVNSQSSNSVTSRSATMFTTTHKPSTSTQITSISTFVTRSENVQTHPEELFYTTTIQSSATKTSIGHAAGNVNSPGSTISEGSRHFLDVILVTYSIFVWFLLS